MSLRFQAEVADLQSRGITFADFLPEEVEDYLNAIRDCDKPFSGVNAELVGIPIKVCDGVYFWKLTIGASVWLDQFAKPWWLDKGQRKAYFWAIVYALIHGRDKGAFTEMTDEQTAYERIKADALKLVIQEDEITEAVDYALGLSNEEPKDNQRDREKAQQNWAEVISRLEAQSGIKAAQSGNHVIMSPTDYSYFDYYQFDSTVVQPLAWGGYIPLEKVYSFDPYAGLETEQRKLVLGIQANLWSEYIPSLSQLEYMMLPRLAALSETAWSPSKKNINRFLTDCKRFERLYGSLGYNYAKSAENED